MYIDQFLSKHPEIKLTPHLLEICREGERRMSLSPDPIHDHHHVGRILGYLQNFIKNHAYQTDYSVLLPAICWHDVWKAQRQTLNPIKLIYYQIYEGIGSLRIFRQHNKHHLPAEVLAKIGYVIRKHSQVQFFSLKTLEAKILRDLDDLDILSAKRLKPLLKKRRSVSPFTRKIGKLFLYLQTRHYSILAAQFPWTRKKLISQTKKASKLLKWL